MGENVAPGPSYKHEVKNSRNEPLDISLDNYMLLLHLSKICMYFLGQRNVKSTITLEKYPLMKELYLTIKGSAIFSRFQFQYAIKGCFLIIAEPFLYTGNTMYHSSKNIMQILKDGLSAELESVHYLWGAVHMHKFLTSFLVLIF